MAIELVSFKLCPFVQRVTTLLHEKDAAFSIRYIDLRNKPDWFLSISPRGRVPVLIVDDRPLFESAALLEFVDETHGPALLPADPFERARQRAYVSFAGDVFGAHYKLSAAPGEDEFAAARQALIGQLGAFEEALGDHPFFGGEHFGLVDAAIAPALSRMVFVAERGVTGLFGSLGRVSRWAYRLAGRPSVQKSVPPDFDALYLDSLRASAPIGRRLAA